MRTQFAGIKVLAMDLIGTLVRKAAKTFEVRGPEYLAENGHHIEPGRFRTIFRKRYLEYSMGNYVSDREFYSVFSADLAIGAWQPWLETLTDIRIQCSSAFDDAQPFLEHASRTYRLILSSNYVGEWARRMLINNHWEAYFRELVISSDCHFRKPSQGFFLELLKVSDVKSPAEILVIGDSPVNDVYGATGAGLQAILVRRNAKAGEFAFPKTVPVVRSLDELTHFLTGKQLVGR